jgi:hypothetical protein
VTERLPWYLAPLPDGVFERHLDVVSSLDPETFPEFLRAEAVDTGYRYIPSTI